MTTNFPTSLDTFINPASTDSQATVSHASQHDNINDAVAALEAKVGINSSAVTSSIDYKINNSLVTSLSSPNSTLTVAGSTSLTADLNLSHANTWAGVQTFTSGNLIAPNINPTAASGSNVAGTNFVLSGGQGTGTANSGNIVLQISPSSQIGVSGSATTAYQNWLNVQASNGLTEFGDKANNYVSASTMKIYGGSGFGGAGIQLINQGTSTGGNAGVNFLTGTTSMSQILNTGGFCYIAVSTRPAFVMNSGGNNYLTIAEGSGAPARGIIGYAVGVNTTPTTESLSWREVISSGVSSYLRFITPPDTNMTASTESIGMQHGGDTSAATVTRQWATGALATQRENVFVAPTYGFVGASTITNASTVDISGAPIAGTNATITNSYAFTIATSKFGINGNGLIKAYNNIPTAGWGMPAIYGSGRSTGQTGAVASVATYTIGAADGSFIVSANANITTFVAGTFNVTVAYTDETNTAQTLKLNFSSLTGTIGIAIAAAGPFEGIPAHIRCKASTSVTIATSGTFTSLTYNVEGLISQLQ